MVLGRFAEMVETIENLSQFPSKTGQLMVFARPAEGTAVKGRQTRPFLNPS